MGCGSVVVAADDPALVYSIADPESDPQRPVVMLRQAYGDDLHYGIFEGDCAVQFVCDTCKQNRCVGCGEMLLLRVIEPDERPSQNCVDCVVDHPDAVPQRLLHLMAVLRGYDIATIGTPGWESAGA